MSSNLLENITGYLTPDVISKASSFLGESPSNTSKAMSGIIPTLLSGVTNMASQPAGATQLASLLSSGGHDGSILNNLSSLFAGGSATTAAISQGQELLGPLLGNKTDAVTSAISSFSGIGRSSAGSLIALAAPLVLGAIGKMRATQNLSTTALASMLTGQKATFAAA